MNKYLCLLIVLAATMLPAGCTDETTTAGNPGSGTGGTGIASGPITQFGSVFVEGLEFDTSNAVYIRDGQRITGVDNEIFDVGEVVVVRGIYNENGLGIKAVSIVFEDNVEGPVTRAAENNVLEVAGQRVIFNSNTVVDIIDPAEISPAHKHSVYDIDAGNIVEVSGFVDQYNNIQATHIRKLQDNFTPGNEIELKGIVSSLDSVMKQFMINNLTVDYSAAVLNNFDTNQLVQGQYVEVRSQKNIVDLVMSADVVVAKTQGISGEQGDEVLLQGIITKVDSIAVFEINGTRVLITSNTLIENGVASDLVAGVRLVVEGTLNAQGILQAREIELIPEDPHSLESYIEAVDAVKGTITLLGITVSTNHLTEYEDLSFRQDRLFGLASIQVNDFVEAFGHLDPAGNFVAAKINRENPEPKAEMQGLVENLDATVLQFELLGVTVIIAPNAVLKNINGVLIDLDTFMAVLQSGATFVEVEGPLIGQYVIDAQKLIIRQNYPGG